MSRSRTVQEVFLSALRHADMEASDFVDAATEGLELVNDSAQRLYDDLVDAKSLTYQLAEPVELTTTANQAHVDLGVDVFKVHGVDIWTGGRWRPIHPFDLQNREDFQPGTGWGVGRTRYLLEGFAQETQRLRFLPTPTAVERVQLWYVPNFERKCDVKDDLVLPNGWHDWIAYDVAVHLAIKEEANASQLRGERERRETRILESAAQVDHGEPTRVRDVGGFGEPFVDREALWPEGDLYR